ncbi:MAG: hypothetical protein NVSMB31_04750 [Vulcanimicrobiaceae bacterium]
MGSRISTVGALVVAEIMVVGAIIYALSGAAPRATAVNIGADRVIGVMNAGDAPHVVVSDPDSRVVLLASSDGRVHVIDRSEIHGFVIHGPKEYPIPRMTRTADGLRIERASRGSWLGVIGESNPRIEVDVPAHAIIDVEKSSGINATGMHGSLYVRSQDGSINLHDVRGVVDAQTDDGHIDAIDVQSAKISLISSSGHLKLDNVTTQNLNATTRDGHITARNMHVDAPGSTVTLHTGDGPVEFYGNAAPDGTYDLSTSDGHIRLDVPELGAYTIHARTQDGSIRVDGHRTRDQDDTAHYDVTGSGAGKFNLATQSGSITINTTGVHS